MVMKETGLISRTQFNLETNVVVTSMHLSYYEVYSIIYHTNQTIQAPGCTSNTCDIAHIYPLMLRCLVPAPQIANESFSAQTCGGFINE